WVPITLNPRETKQKQAPAPGRSSGSNPYMIDTEEYRRSFPKKAIKEFDKGIKADAEGKRVDAIGHYQKAVEIAPSFYPAHNNLGSDYLAKSDLKSAQEQFAQAIKLNQSDPQAHLNMANLALTMKNYDGALHNVQEALRRDPNSALGQFLLGSIYARTEKLPEAERALRAALAINPAMARVHLELVNVYIEQKQNPKAIAELKAFLEGAPDDPMAPHAKKVLTRLESAR